MSDLATRLADELGSDAILTGTAAAPYDCLTPAPVCAPADAAGVELCLRLAAEHNAGVVPAGFGLRLGHGNPPSRCDLVLSTRRLTRVLAHEAADLTLVVEAGASLTDLDRYLAPFGQRLAADPPAPECTSIGGWLATDVFGPQRRCDGKARDQLIGIRACLVDGTSIRGGGRVVKNVAGYDLMKLMIGSFGSLAVITEACFKVRPRPARHSLGLVSCTDLGAALGRAERVRRLAIEPTLLRAVDGGAACRLDLPTATLAIGLAGDEGEVEAQMQAIHAADLPIAWHTGDAALAHIETLRDLQRADTRAIEPLVARLSLRPQRLAAALAKVGNASNEMDVVADLDSGTAFVRRDLASEEDRSVLAWAIDLRAAATADGGHVVFEVLPPRLRPHIDPWGEVAGWQLMRGIKHSLDPQQRLSPGRFVGGL